MLDNEWHTVRVEREGSAAALYIDGNQEANNRSEGLEGVEVQPPLFIGGLSQESVSLRSKIFNNRKDLVRKIFGKKSSINSFFAANSKRIWWMLERFQNQWKEIR